MSNVMLYMPDVRCSRFFNKPVPLLQPRSELGPCARFNLISFMRSVVGRPNTERVSQTKIMTAVIIFTGDVSNEYDHGHTAPALRRTKAVRYPSGLVISVIFLATRFNPSARWPGPCPLINLRKVGSFTPTNPENSKMIRRYSASVCGGLG